MTAIINWLKKNWDLLYVISPFDFLPAIGVDDAVIVLIRLIFVYRRLPSLKNLVLIFIPIFYILTAGNLIPFAFDDTLVLLICKYFMNQSLEEIKKENEEFKKSELTAKANVDTTSKS